MRMNPSAHGGQVPWGCQRHVVPYAPGERGRVLAMVVRVDVTPSREDVL